MKKIIFAIIAFLSLGTCGLNAKIFMIGDSHVSIKKYPQRMAEIIDRDMPEEEFEYWGIGGAGLYTFINSEANMRRIYNAKPDILIVHLGTNDSYSRVFKDEYFQNNLAKFYGLIRKNLPDCIMVFVTPFYNKNKAKGTGKWQLNNNTRLCADRYKEFAAKHDNIYIIDNNAEHGMDFINKKLIRDDYVHLTAEGYRVLADQVVESFYAIDDLWEFTPYDE